jgi:opacity protein-like surface antigen
MIKNSAKVLIICLLAFSFDAFSEEEGRYYFGLGAGLSNGYVSSDGGLPSGKYGGASLYSFALGRQFNNNIALEVEVSSRGDFINNKNQIETDKGNLSRSVSISSLSAMLNGYYYYYNQGANFKPYITGGVGLSKNKVSNRITVEATPDEYQFSEIIDGSNTTSFSWKLGTGARYALDSHFEVDFRYQFINLGNVSLGRSESNYNYKGYLSSGYITPRSSELRAHEIMAGIIYKF